MVNRLTLGGLLRVDRLFSSSADTHGFTDHLKRCIGSDAMKGPPPGQDKVQ